jgi:hypothetical protein
MAVNATDDAVEAHVDVKVISRDLLDILPNVLRQR